MKLFSIDPGPEQSAWLVYDTESRYPAKWVKQSNDDAMANLMFFPEIEEVAIEHIASYGMGVGKTTFETCIWIGRFTEAWWRRRGKLPLRIYRQDVKLHICRSMKANDSNVRTALIDRYGPGKDKAIGKKASPGPLYGLTKDCWSALGIAITASETLLS